MKKQTPMAMMKISFMIMLFGTIQVAFAQEMSRREPPKEAISICEDQDEGSSCTFSSPRGDSLSGTCSYTPDKKYFVCMPEGGPKGPSQER